MTSSGATDPASLGFKTTADLEPAHGPVGQEKAMEALAFGAGIKGPGYHMLVIGREGTGRRTAARAKLQEVAEKAERPPTGSTSARSIRPAGFAP